MEEIEDKGRMEGGVNGKGWGVTEGSEEGNMGRGRTVYGKPEYRGEPEGGERRPLSERVYLRI